MLGVCRILNKKSENETRASFRLEDRNETRKIAASYVNGGRTDLRLLQKHNKPSNIRLFETKIQ